MKARIESEVKIFGINFFIVSAAFTVTMIVLSIIAGNLLDFYPVSFEVVFPFFVTIVVGEWGKTRADSNFDIIAAQSKSLFKWVLLRYIIAFAISSLFAVFSMAGASVMRYEMPIWELIVLYFPPTFFLSSLCALLHRYITCPSFTVVIAVIRINPIFRVRLRWAAALTDTEKFTVCCFAQNWLTAECACANLLNSNAFNHIKTSPLFFCIRYLAY